MDAFLDSPQITITTKSLNLYRAKITGEIFTKHYREAISGVVMQEIPDEDRLAVESDAEAGLAGSKELTPEVVEKIRDRRARCYNNSSSLQKKLVDL